MQLPSNFFPLKNNTNLSKRTIQAIRSLETEIKAIHSQRNRLEINVNDSLLEITKLGNKEIGAFYIDEYDDLVNLLNIVKSVEMLLQNLSVKIDSIRYFQEFVNILDSAMYSTRIIKSDISRIVPAIDSTLYRISNSIIEMKTVLQINETPARRGYELPVTIPEVNIELPVNIR